MIREIQVVEDAIVDGPGLSRRSTPWVRMLVAFAVGLGSGAVFFGPVVNTTLDTAAANPDTPMVLGDPIGPVGLATALPGFPDAIVAIIETPDRSIEHLLWPQARGPSTRQLPVTPGSTLELEVSGIWVALTQVVPDGEGSLLSMGRPTGVNPVASGVGAMAWHDSAQGTVGFTRLHEGIWGLWKATSFPIPDLVTDLGRAHQPAGQLAFGAWGWAISSTEPGHVAVLDPDGTPKTTVEGLVLGSGSRGLLVLTDTGVVLVEANGALQVLELPAGSSGTVVAGAISPDGTRAALLTSVGIAVVGLDDPSRGDWKVAEGGKAPVAWSSDSGFVLFPAAPMGVLVLDTETGAVELVLDDVAVHSVGVIGLSGSS